MTGQVPVRMQVRVRGVATDEEIAAVLAALAGRVRPDDRLQHWRTQGGRDRDRYERWRRSRIIALTRSPADALSGPGWPR